MLAVSGLVRHMSVTYVSECAENRIRMQSQGPAEAGSLETDRCLHVYSWLTDAPFLSLRGLPERERSTFVYSHVCP